MLNPSEIAEFEQRGVVRLAGFLSDDIVAPARDRVLDELRRLGVYRNGAWCCDAIQRPRYPDGGGKYVRALKTAREFEPIACDALVAAMTQLLGEPLRPLNEAPQLLFTLPNADRWQVPPSTWHLDLPRLPMYGAPGVHFFTFLTEVAPSGGGTLVVAGSHLLFNEGREIRSKELKRLLKQQSWFKKLMSDGDAQSRDRFMREPANVLGIDVQVVELHGRPGDVYLVDARMLHSLAPNASVAPRVMLTNRYLRASLWHRIMTHFAGDEARAMSG